MNLNLGTILIRADASAEIGTGHVMRCLALAQAWQDAGGRAVFALQQCTPAIIPKLLQEGFESHFLAPNSDRSAAFTASLALDEAVSWVVLDGYSFDRSYRTKLKNAGLRLLCIDDNAENHLLADIVVNSNLHAGRSMYPIVAPSTRFLLGPRFAMLRREFRAWGECRSLPHCRRRVLITMGGSDPQRLTEIALQAIQLVNVADLEFRVAASSSNPRISILSAYCAKHEIELVLDGNMPGLMAWADLAVAAAGATCLELCFFRVPMIVIDAAANQVAVARELQRRGIAVHLPLSQSTASKIAEKIRDVAGDPEILEQMSRGTEGLVDGRGAEQVVAAVIANSLKLRRAVLADARPFFELANEPVARRASFYSTPIPWEDHERWFLRRLDDPDSALFVFEDTSGTAVAVMRFQAENQGVFKISITIAPECRGLGLAPHMIEHAASKMFEQSQVEELCAFIKPENAASIHAFQAAGFSLCGTSRINVGEALIYTLHRSEAKRAVSEIAKEARCG